MVAYVHFVRRIGEHRRENVFWRVIVKRQVFFIFARNYFSQTILINIFTFYIQNLTLRETAL